MIRFRTTSHHIGGSSLCETDYKLLQVDQEIVPVR